MWFRRKNPRNDDWGLHKREHRLQIGALGGKGFKMGDKVALPSLSLPKQKTHWTVGVVVAAGVLFVILGAAFYTVLRNRQAEADAIARREADRLASIKAETEKAQAEKARAEAEKAASEAKKKADEAAALVAQKKASAASATASADSDEKKDKGKKKSGHKGGSTKVASGKSGGSSASTSSPASASAAPPPPPKPSSSKASKDIDDLLKSFR